MNNFALHDYTQLMNRLCIELVEVENYLIEFADGIATMNQLLSELEGFGLQMKFLIETGDNPIGAGNYATLQHALNTIRQLMASVEIMLSLMSEKHVKEWIATGESISYERID